MNKKIIFFLVSLFSTKALGELKTLNGANGPVIQDVVTGTLWESGIRTGLSWSEANNYCA